MIFKKPEPKILYYTDCQIPARLFFDVMHTEDYQLLGTVGKEDCEDAYDKIFDEYLQIMPNPRLISYVRRKSKVENIQLKITTIKSILAIIAFTSLTQAERDVIIDQLNSIEGVKIRMSKDPKIIVSEIERIHTSVLGELRNILNMELEQLPKDTAKAKYVFEKDIVNLRLALDGMHINDDINLYMFAELTKSATEISNQRKKQNGSK